MDSFESKLLAHTIKTFERGSIRGRYAVTWRVSVDCDKGEKAELEIF